MTRQRKLAAVAAGVGAATGGVVVAVLLATGATSSPASDCRSSVAEALQAKRITGPGPSYAKDNPLEFAAVKAYLEGGVRPIAITHMGLHLVLLEDVCRSFALPPTTTTTTTEPPTTTTEPPSTTTPEPPSIDYPDSYFTGPAGQSNILPTKEGAFVGIWDSGAVGTNRIKLRESQVGRTFDIGAGSYVPSTTANFDGKMNLIVNEGRIPLVSMHSNHTVAAINSGVEDAWHRDSARAVKALGVPTFVRLFHEFNGEWMPYFTPGDTVADAQPFISAWRRVVGIWKAEGATNAAFVWHTAGGSGANAAVRYPGDAWVDWIGISAYTYAPIQWAGFYQDYADLWQLLGWAREYKLSIPSRYEDVRYKPFHDSFTKPLCICEMGHFEDSRKAQWLRDAKANILGTFDPPKENGPWQNVHALLYSDYGTEADPNGQAWTLDRPASGLDGFRDMVNDPYFKTR